MADIFTKEKRSWIMSRIRGKWTSPERKIHNLLKGWKVRHRMHPKMKGSPDIILKDSKAVVFVHGCFWHRCARCYRESKSRREYWIPKIEKNAERDRRDAKILKSQGFNVIIVWEHDLKDEVELKRWLGFLIRGKTHAKDHCKGDLRSAHG